MKIRLCKAITTPQHLRVFVRVNGYNRPQNVDMIPGKEYEAPEEGVLKQLLTKTVLVKRSTPQLKQQLESLGVSYTEKVCRVCGGKTIGIEYPIVEVVE